VRNVGTGASFVLEAPLESQGAGGVHWRGRRQDTGEAVAVKGTSLREGFPSGARDAGAAWKRVELFQREGRVLRGLAHPGIPRFVDAWEEHGEDDVRYWLVQEHVEGGDLETKVSKEGVRFAEAELVQVATQLWPRFAYLHGLSPPIVHRDVKPENVVLGWGAAEGGERGDTRAYLVDFGSVQDGSKEEADVVVGLGSTVAGTFGYMSPEQLRGKADARSDLYGLGATLIFCAAGRDPSRLPSARLRVDFRDACPGLSPWLLDLLEDLVEPAPEDRPGNARLVLERLRMGPEAAGLLNVDEDGGKGSSGAGRRRQMRLRSDKRSAAARWRRGTWPRGKPAGSRLEIEATEAEISVKCPPAGVSPEVIQMGTFAFAWNVFIAVWTAGALAGGGPLFAAFSAPFWVAGASLAKAIVTPLAVHTKTVVNVDTFSVTYEVVLPGGKVVWSKTETGSTADIEGVSVEDSTKAGVDAMPTGESCMAVMHVGVNTYTLAPGLKEVEQLWLADQVNEWLFPGARVDREYGEQ